MKTGSHPFISRLKLFTQWGIEFNMGKCELTDKAVREVHYAGKDSIVGAVDKVYPMPVECFTAITEEDGHAEGVAGKTNAELQNKIAEAEKMKPSTKKNHVQDNHLTVPDQYRPDNQSHKRMYEHKKAQRWSPHKASKEQ